MSHEHYIQLTPLHWLVDRLLMLGLAAFTLDCSLAAFVIRYIATVERRWATIAQHGAPS